MRPLSGAEKGYVASGNRLGFWQSRLAGGDPLAGTALSIVTNSGFEGMYANGVLFNAISARNDSTGNYQGMAAIHAEQNQIGVQIMQGYAGLIQSRGAADPGAIATMHFDVFAQHGLPADTYGGSLFTGSAGIAALASPLYMTCH